MKAICDHLHACCEVIQTYFKQEIQQDLYVFILFNTVIYLFIHLFTIIYSFIHPFIHSSFIIHPFIHPFIHSFIHSSIHPSIHPFIHSSIHPFILMIRNPEDPRQVEAYNLRLLYFLSIRTIQVISLLVDVSHRYYWYCVHAQQIGYPYFIIIIIILHTSYISLYDHY